MVALIVINVELIITFISVMTATDRSDDLSHLVPKMKDVMMEDFKSELKSMLKKEFESDNLTDLVPKLKVMMMSNIFKTELKSMLKNESKTISEVDDILQQKVMQLQATLGSTKLSKY